jgi:MFS family permease
MMLTRLPEKSKGGGNAWQNRRRGDERMVSDSQRRALAVTLRWQHWQRNFWLGVLNGILFKVGITFAHPSTVLAVFLTKLTGNELFAGLLTAVAGLGWFLPPMFVAGYVEALPRKLPLYARMALGRALGWLWMIAVVVFLAPHAPFLAAVLFLLGYAIFTVTGGIGTLAFMDIFARTVPFRRRGAFWGLRMFFGSLLSIGVGIFVRHVLRQEWGLTFPNNYAVLMACSFCAFGLAWLTFFLVHEPPPEWTPLPRSWREQWATMKQLWQERRDFRQLILTRLLLDFELIALPYYSTYAVTVLGAKPSLLGTFIVAETVGGMFANALWSTLADRRSNLFVLQSAALLVALPSGWVLLLSACHFLFGLPVLPLYPLTYFFLALAMTGISIAFTNYVLELADDAHRPTYLALSNASESGMMMLPVLGGILLKFVPHPVLFAIAFTGALIAARQSRRLRPAFATIPPRRFPVAP